MSISGGLAAASFKADRFAIGCTIALPAAAQQLLGSGSTFVYPIMAKWAAAHEKINGVQIEYRPIGSSGGIRDIRAGAVDFGASDAPLPPEQLAHGRSRPVSSSDWCNNTRCQPRRHRPRSAPFHGPATCRHLTLGRVRNWNDPAIVAVNPGVKLPIGAITVLSIGPMAPGTTFNWVDYLSKVSGTWKAQVGESTSVAWPIGLGGNGATVALPMM